MSSGEEAQRRNINFILYDQDNALDDKYTKLISDVLSRLPAAAVQKFAQTVPQFVIIDKGIIGHTCSFRQCRIVSRKAASTKNEVVLLGETWLIILIAYEMEKLSPAEQESTLAEELAHTYLRHTEIENVLAKYTGDSRRDSVLEQEAAALVREWGFKYYLARRTKPKRGRNRKLRSPYDL
ncbi:MAG: hypothetical protein ACREBU_02995 [Nitrososphaera sp.]